MNSFLSLKRARRLSLFIMGLAASVFIFAAAQAATTQPAIKLSASSVDGTNVGTARLGMHVLVTPTVTGTTSTAVTWKLNGAGSLSDAGLYAAPASMPSSSAVSVTATLTSNPSVSATYNFVLVNPVPEITGLAPAGLPRGTSTLTITGYGFVPGTVLQLNGSPVATTYLSPTQVKAQISVASNATDSFPLVAKNPAPAGGTSSTVQAPVANIGIKLNASSVDGNNAGTARLGMHVLVTPTVNGTTDNSVTWKLTGAGSLSNTGLYSAPVAMPANANASVTATLADNPAISATYNFSIVNPVPVISKVSPVALPRGTSTVLVGGSGFVSGTRVLVNGASVATTYVSDTQVNAQVSVASNTSGLAIAASNPAPVGGVSSAVQVPVSDIGMTLNAASSDGTNTGTARLGLHVQVTPKITGTTDNKVTWGLNGAGTLSTSGLYTAPTTVGTNPDVTVTATLTDNPAVTASYKLTLINPVPALYTVTPTALSSMTNTISMTGASIVPGSMVLVNGSPVTTTYKSWNILAAQINASVGQSGALSVTIQNPSPGGGVSSPVSITVAVPKTLTVTPASLGTGITTITVTGSNFSSSSIVYVNNEPVPTTYVSSAKLTAAAFVAPWRTTPVPIGVGTAAGPDNVVTLPVVNQSTVSYDAASRFSLQAAFGPRPDVVAQIQQLGFTGFLNQQFAQPASTYPQQATSSDLTKIQFTYNALKGNNLLRQRVAFSLEEFITASIINGYIYPTAVPWQELMEKDAFGNFRNLMTDVTMNGTMGYWLNLGNNWSPLDATQHPNQNYARELMQLFTIGPVKLNDDGSTQLDANGKAIPSYDDSTVLDMSRALTGWALAPADSSAFTGLFTDFSIPMQANDSRHDHGQKTLFGNIVLPAGQDITTDRDAALNAIFNHPNVPPFVSRLLIQHLVKSDPSPAYIQRISKVFENDGTGVRGNLRAVVQAILLDEEARAGDEGTVAASDGHLQEPILYFMAVMSGLQTTPTTTALVYAERGLGEHIWSPESVFSFYSPSFNIPGTTINAPEFQLFDANYLPQRSQILYSILAGKETGFNATYQTTGWLMTHFSTIPNLLDAVNHVFFHGTMPAATQQVIENYVATLPNPTDQKVQALYLALNSDSFQISH